MSACKKLLTIALLYLAVLPSTGFGQDSRAFAVDQEVAVTINWQSFLDAGFPASIEGPLLDTVINSYTRWIHVGGMRVKPKFEGYTTRTSAQANEILVQANTQHSGWRDAAGNTCTAGSAGCTCNDCNRLASRFGNGNRVTIVVHRRRATDGAIWPHVFWRTYDSTENDIRGSLLHEFGHAFGLDHETSTESIMFASYRWWHAYGPNSKDISDIIALYGRKTDLRFRVRQSTDSGLSWSTRSSNLTGLGVTTTLPPGVSRDPDRTILFYTSPTHKPSWIIGNNTGSSFDTGKWWTFGGEASVYGTAGHGYDDEYMMAWADHSSDDDIVRVVRSTDGGESWHWRNPPSSRTIGTPAVHKVSGNTWVLAYATLGANSGGLGDTGRIVARVSTNDGAIWGPEVELHSFYRADNGVSMTSNGAGEVRISFSWAKDWQSSQNYLMRTMVAHVDSGNIVFDRMIYGNEGSRTAPSIAKASGKFVRAWREPNYLTSINTRNSDAGSGSWDNYRRVVTTSHINPAVAAFRNWSYMFMYTLQ